jgi:hypothetical protein
MIPSSAELRSHIVDVVLREPVQLYCSPKLTDHGCVANVTMTVEGSSKEAADPSKLRVDSAGEDLTTETATETEGEAN